MFVYSYKNNYYNVLDKNILGWLNKPSAILSLKRDQTCKEILISNLKTMLC